MGTKRKKQLDHKKLERQNRKITRALEAPISQMEKAKEQKGYIYVYGITNSKDTHLNIRGLKEMPILKINFKDLTVLTSFYPNLSPQIEEGEAMHHAEILNKIAEKNKKS
ncbi:hypothetical protein HYX19_00295 [Candidatus Woesearchaeota archaeon]|nr:hypothetical protein [Candidatus Woesearchaeota archaeon]